MSGIAGFFHRPCQRLADLNMQKNALNAMQQSLFHTKYDTFYGQYHNDDIAMAQVVNSCQIKEETNHTIPLLTGFWQGRTASLAFCGELYNDEELIYALTYLGVFSKKERPTDAQIMLYGLLTQGKEFLSKVNGVFGFSYYDHNTHCLYLIRDRLGVTPLYYAQTKDLCFLFGSEQKAILSFPMFQPFVTQTELLELLSLGPGHTPGLTCYHGIHEVLPGHILCIDEGGKITHTPYWSLTATSHTETYEDTVSHVQSLLVDAVKLSCKKNTASLGAFLSGGLDSSIVTSLASDYLKSKDLTLHTYSFDFCDSAKHFVPNDFQPTLDEPYVEIMRNYCGTTHKSLRCDNEALLFHLNKAVDMQDGPCMADIAASLLYFCRQTEKSEEHKKQVILTGECADEVFGGYPWFHKPELMNVDHFPWNTPNDTRSLLLNDAVLKKLPLMEYQKEAFHKECQKVPYLNENKEDQNHRRTSYLSITLFMQTLLDRMDRAGRFSGLIPRVPFADYRIVSYLYNVPKAYKYQNGVKGLLKDAAGPWLPQEICNRKKSPYPKTYHPQYQLKLGTLLMEMLSDKTHPLTQLIDISKVQSFLQKPDNLTSPWYGQLMAGPQLLAYYLQLGYWLDTYKVTINL